MPMHTPRKNYFLVAARLGFATWTLADRELAHQLWGDPKVTSFLSATGELSSEAIDERLKQEIKLQTEFGYQYWPIYLLATGEHVGCCGLRPYKPAEQIAELGFHLRSNFWRQGFGQEAASAVIDHGLNVLGMRALFAGHHHKNEASRHLLTKLGFESTGEEFYPPTGLMHPSYLLHRK